MEGEHFEKKEKPSEYLAEYDGNNTLTGRIVSREDAHSEGLWHRTVHIYVIRKTDQGTELLVHMRSKKKKQYAGRFDPVMGGHVKAGESEVQTALSEIAEEIGITPDPVRMEYKGFAKKDDPVNAPNDREFNMIYVYVLSEDEQENMHPDSEEIERIEWMSVQIMQDSLMQNPHRWRPSKDEVGVGLAIASIVYM